MHTFAFNVKIEILSARRPVPHLGPSLLSDSVLRLLRTLVVFFENTSFRTKSLGSYHSKAEILADIRQQNSAMQKNLS